MGETGRLPVLLGGLFGDLVVDSPATVPPS